ncbi:MAG: precorrin-2 dehydrogenase [Actinomycetota bacterium]|jgi:precorrin-2 dehydrogenase/sirohydrochlorin ferrochelatase|nr:precorrin-2 dehydrogenase [Actinomycetota bacterium]
MPVEARLYPVHLVVDGIPCLVVGGGRIAARKASGLRDCGARVHVVAVRVGPEVRALPGITWEERAYEATDLVGQRLVMAATDDPGVNARVYADGTDAGLWVNSADDPANCSFILPAVARRGPLSVAISTGGHSPALAAWLRHHVETEMGPEYETLLELLSEERARVLARGASTEGLDWQKALDSDMLALIRAGQVQQARERLQACLSSSSD